VNWRVRELLNADDGNATLLLVQCAMYEAQLRAGRVGRSRTSHQVGLRRRERKEVGETLTNLERGESRVQPPQAPAGAGPDGQGKGDGDTPNQAGLNSTAVGTGRPSLRLGVRELEADAQKRSKAARPPELIQSHSSDSFLGVGFMGDGTQGQIARASGHKRQETWRGQKQR
jgi:hypothetical protein